MSLLQPIGQEMGAGATPENSAVSPPAQSAIGGPTPGGLSAAPAPASRSAARGPAPAPSGASPPARWGNGSAPRPRPGQKRGPPPRGRRPGEKTKVGGGR